MQGYGRVRALRQAGLRAAARELRRELLHPRRSKGGRTGPRRGFTGGQVEGRQSSNSTPVSVSCPNRVPSVCWGWAFLFGASALDIRIAGPRRTTHGQATPHRAGLPTATDCRTHAGAAGTGGNLAPTPLRFVGFFYITDRPISTRETKPLFRRVGAKRHALCIESAGMGGDHCPREPTVMFGRLWRDAP